MNLIEDLKTNLCWNDSHIQDILAIAPKEYELKAKTDSFTFRDIENLCEFFNIDMNSIAENKVDYFKLRRSLSVANNSIPEQYLKGAGTYMEFIRVVYNFIRSIYNEKVAHQILKKIGLTTDILLDDEIMVNSELINDLMNCLTLEFNIGKNAIRDLSFSGYNSEKRKKVMDLMSTADDDFTIMQKLADNSSSWEKNFEYSAKKIDVNYFMMKSKSAEFANDLAGKAELVTEQTILYKKFIIAAIYPMLGKRMPKIINVTNEICKGRQEVNYLFKIH